MQSSVSGGWIEVLKSKVIVLHGEFKSGPTGLETSSE